MNLQPSVTRITIYPVKSLDGVALQEGMIAEGGCILHDREYAIVDSTGRFINGKANPMVHLLRSEVDFENETISFRHHHETEWKQFHLRDEKPAIDAYLTGFFGMPATLLQNKNGRFLDIPDISGITLLSTASLQAVSEWYGNIAMEETRRRFRATVEIEHVPAFWEDHLFSEEGTAVEFTVGDVMLLGMSPRARCVVPTRQPESGEVTHAFPKTFTRHRAASLPPWSKLEAFDHYYYLTVNCLIPPGQVGKAIHVGDEVEVMGVRVLE